MKSFSSELLREKFIIQDADKGDTQDAMVALSNRLSVPLSNQRDETVETYVVRAHNMHLTVRMAARIIQTFNQGGPISSRIESFDWDKVWDSIVSNYEFAYNPERWIAVYHQGKCIFSKGEYHPFFDIVENCDHTNQDDYDYAIPHAERLFSQAGKDVKIIHNSNVALNVAVENREARCGIILRGPNKTTTFSFGCTPKKSGQALNIAQCLGSAAAFLEGIQLAFLVGMNDEKNRLGLIKRFSKEEKQTRDGRRRLNRLSSEVSNLENAFKVHYRPEKPDFYVLLVEAEEFARQVLVPPEEDAEASADSNDDQEDQSDQD